MADEFVEFSCAECGARVELLRGPGHTSPYLVDLDRPVPEAFEIPTCTGCGAHNLTVGRGRALADAQAPYFAECGSVGPTTPRRDP